MSCRWRAQERSPARRYLLTFRRESRVTPPSIWVQNIILPPLWTLAKVVGKRPYYDHWDSRTDTEQPA